MQRHLQLGGLLVLALALAVAAPRADSQQGLATQSAAAPEQSPLTPDQVRDLISRTLDNQHRNDTTLDSFERIEHHVERTGGPDGPISEDKTYRVVPSGSATLRLVVKQDGKPVSPATYQRQLRDWERILEVAIHPDDPRQVASLAKWQKRMRTRARFVDAVPDAYRITWVGREIRDGRMLEKLHFEANPDYKPRGDTTDWLTHARATVWIDPQAAQVAHIEADIVRDISIGGGFLGKIYHGGHFMMEQAPAAPGIWEPSVYQYDFSGRKFLFPFEIHELTAASHYRFIGPADKALAIARKDLSSSNCCTFNADP